MKIRNEIPVVVAGGGIGGLAAALALAIKGFRVTVLEQASQFGEIGAGIQLAPNAWAVLDALQVGALVKRDAVFIEKLLLMDGISGDAVIEIPLDHRFRERYGNPYAVTHRADIHTSLLEGCQARSDLIELRTNSRVSGYAIETRGVRVDIEGDEPIEARGRVGAGGARAAVSRSLHGDGDPPASGHMCYRAVLPVQDMPADLRWPAATLWAGPDTHIVHYPLRGGRLFNLVATVVRTDTPGGHNEEAAPQEVLPLFPHHCDKPMSIMRVPKVFRRFA